MGIHHYHPLKIAGIIPQARGIVKSSMGKNAVDVPLGLLPVIREKKRLKPRSSIAQAIDFRR